MLPYITPAQAKQIASQGGGSTPGASNVLIYNSEITWDTGTDIIVLNDLNLTEAECIAALDSGKMISINLKIKDYPIQQSTTLVGDVRVSSSNYSDEDVGSMPGLFPCFIFNEDFMIYFLRTAADEEAYWRSIGMSEEGIEEYLPGYKQIIEAFDCGGKWIMLLAT